jgi:hypothetical protein
MTEKPTKPAVRHTRSRKPKLEPRQPTQPTHGEIAERAYFIHLEEAGADALGDWLRAEAELAAA